MKKLDKRRSKPNKRELSNMKLSYQNIKKLSVLSLTICIVSFVGVHYYPTGNFIGGPVIEMMVYFPLGLVNLFIVGSIWSGKNNSIKYNQRIFWISTLIALIFVLVLIYYLLGN